MVPPGLQHHTKPRPPPLITPCGVNPKNPDLTRRAHPESLQDLDGGPLASPVRPEQGQHLATARAELDALQHIHRPVAHPETANVDHRTLARLLDLRAQHPQLVHHSTRPFDLLNTMICSNYYYVVLALQDVCPRRSACGMDVSSGHPGGSGSLSHPSAGPTASPVVDTGSRGPISEDTRPTSLPLSIASVRPSTSGQRSSGSSVANSRAMSRATTVPAPRCGPPRSSMARVATVSSTAAVRRAIESNSSVFRTPTGAMLAWSSKPSAIWPR